MNKCIETSGTKEMFANLGKLKKWSGNLTIDVGLFPESTYPDGTPVATIGAQNQFGCPEKKIPARPFFTYANEDLRKTIPKLLKRVAKGKGALNINTKDSKLAALIGEHGVNAVKDAITGKGVSYVPNAPSTIARKGSDRPLIDSALMRNSITYKKR